MDIKENVREFYNKVGWQEVDEGVYQNARYEDLRPVSQDYIHRCHMRVAQHLKDQGHYLLDAGSGPLQYPEYLTYSRSYRVRVCADISLVALQEARRKIGDIQNGGHGMFVVADIANLPFKGDVFDGAISLHTIHHLPKKEHAKAYGEMYRALAPNRTGVIVQGWSHSPFMNLFTRIVKVRKRLWLTARRLLRKDGNQLTKKTSQVKSIKSPRATKGTFVDKHDARWFKREVAPHYPVEIRVWRSLSVRFLRNFVHEKWGGRHLLRFVFWLEEQFPRFFGEKGSYPLIVLKKTGDTQPLARHAVEEFQIGDQNQRTGF